MAERRQPTVEELANLITATIKRLERVEMDHKTFDGQPNGHVSVGQVLKAVYEERKRLINTACALAGLDGPEQAECIFDVDRPVSEWKLQENTDLLDESRCSCGEFHDPLSTSPCKGDPDADQD